MIQYTLRQFKQIINQCHEGLYPMAEARGFTPYFGKEVNSYLPVSKKIEIHQNKYLNNLVEQDYRFIKKITQPMRDYKATYPAHTTLSGSELHHWTCWNDTKQKIW